MASGSPMRDGVAMNAMAEYLALRAMELVGSPGALVVIALLVMATFSGIAGRIVLYLETLPTVLSARSQDLRP
jgi:hypothetical protein